MAMNCAWTYFIVFLLAASDACHDVTSVLLKHIERLDAKIEEMDARHRVEIRTLGDKMAQQEEMYKLKIAGLDRRLAHVEELNSLLLAERDDNRANLRGDPRHKAPENKTDGLNETNGIPEANTEHLERIKPGLVEPSLSLGEKIRQKKALAESGFNVAFSAYMDKDTDGMGAGQVLIYNQVLLNDGNGYNRHTGIFTAPVAGVYSFSFFVGQRDLHFEWVALWVNSEHKVEAVVDTAHATQDLQGGNTVNLKLANGDAVYVKSLPKNGHVEGSDGARITTFSGFLIYPVETLAVVG